MAIDFSPLFLSMKVTVISTAFVFIVSLLFVYGIKKKDFFGKSALEALILLPMVLPPTVVGFLLILLFGVNGAIGTILEQWFGVRIVFTWVGAAIASFVVSLPIMYQSASAAFDKIDHRLEHAARTMGVSEWKVFRKITLPLAWPGLLAGLILSFARGFGEFGATLMVAGYIPGRTETVPLAIYFAYDAGDYTTATFWVCFILAFAFAIISWIHYWQRKAIKRVENR